MALDYGYGIQQTRDEFGTDSDTRPIFKLKSEEIYLEEGPTQVKTRDTSTDSIWGRDNWGTAYWDGSYANSPVVVRVTNPKNRFIEKFRFSNFEDTTYSTADWDTTNLYCDFTAGEVLQTSSILLNNEDIVDAKPIVTETTGDFNYYLSRDGGITWGIATNNSSLVFGNAEYMLDDFTSTSGWSNDFDGDGIETIATVDDRQGLQFDVNLAGNASSTLHTCDATGNTSATTDCTITLNSSTYKEGTGAINLTKAGGAEILFYKCEETSGTTVTDSSTGGNDGTASRDLSNLTTTGRVDNGFNFQSASNDYIDTGAVLIPTSSDFSLSAWFTTTGAGTKTIFGQYLGSDSTRTLLYVQGGQAHFFVGGSNLISSISTTLNDGEWHHIVMTRNGSDIKLYIDNNEDDSGTYAGNIYQGANTMVGSGDGSSLYFNGKLDDLRIFDFDLDTGEIEDIYNSGSGTSGSLGGNNCGADFTFSSTNLSSTTKRFCIWLYIKDQTTLDKITQIRLYLTHNASGWNAWDLSGDWIGTLTTGWNYIRVKPTDPDTEEGGGADETAIDQMRIRLFTASKCDNWGEGDIIIDKLQQRNQNGYSSLIKETYNADWTGHSTSDTIGFYFYVADTTKFDQLQFSFGDVVGGAVQVKAGYTWYVSNGGIVDGWNYLSAPLSSFTLIGGYTIDFSDIAKLRFQTSYAGGNSGTSPYDDEQTDSYYVSDLKFESQSGTPTTKDDLRFKAVEAGNSTGRISEVRVEYTAE